jgi:RES domain-containing protein
MFANLQPTLQNTSGARWNPKGVAAIYTSIERETALAEADFRLSLEPVRPSKGRTLYKIQMRLSRVVDLTKASVLTELGLTDRELEDPLDYRTCQEIGGAIAFLEYCGVLVPSARRPGGTNLVIYPTLQPVDDEFEVVETEILSTRKRD